MDRYRLKNIIILILSLMNVFLLASLAIREGASISQRNRCGTDGIPLCR